MTLKKLFLPLLLLLCLPVLAQNDTVVQLQEITISDSQLRDYSGTQSVTRLNDSVIGKNSPSLTALLNYSSVIYFKENGPGMVSSPSFRGTNAQQTAVLWNGININSQLTGQTDFNTLNARDFSSISIRGGGGSVVYGSSAIGGSIHLNNELAFGNKLENEGRVDYGSFNTFGAHYNLIAATERFSVNAGISRNSSDNDYQYPGTNIRNENGQYYNSSLNVAFAYKLNPKNILKLYSHAFDAERHFSRTLAAPSKSKYEDTNYRNLVEWTALYNRFTSKLKAAYLHESYKYFNDYTADAHDFGKVKTYIARYDAAYEASETVLINSIIDYTQNDGEGSNIEGVTRKTVSGSLLLRHTPGQKFGYELGIRKEITNVYDSPILFSAGAKYAVSAAYAIKFNASRNFRVPTFNDLYWQGSGNPHLKPETSYQAEIGNELRFKNVSVTITGYYIKLRDMLRWVPAGSEWVPENVGRVNTHGLEALLNWNKQSGGSKFEFNGTYAYTVSREEGRTEQLIYVPFHKATASLAYSYKNISVYYRHLFNGEVFFTSDNKSKIDAYNVSNIGAEYHFRLLGGLDIGLQVLNLWDEEYQNVAMRPLPGRNYTMYLNLKF